VVTYRRRGVFKSKSLYRRRISLVNVGVASETAAALVAVKPRETAISKCGCRCCIYRNAYPAPGVKWPASSIEEMVCNEARLLSQAKNESSASIREMAASLMSGGIISRYGGCGGGGINPWRRGAVGDGVRRRLGMRRLAWAFHHFSSAAIYNRRRRLCVSRKAWHMLTVALLSIPFDIS
jgi:hypothetical protein